MNSAYDMKSEKKKMDMSSVEIRMQRFVNPIPESKQTQAISEQNLYKKKKYAWFQWIHFPGHFTETWSTRMASVN